ncbi:hypothetical protein HNQ80_002351 [Anaerosolibacter carboniphilus]|uniref:Uncharacterized protein n=1 Tax=Anaerosolibacter carboniphilus TaxID=1417629 RepID=A0A841KZB4_9FIRM|nr:hypothetical protein [Anaerosolibacter carboniphilus]MBB6216252.1 hypothetical protein [Anaerosolibacter carboniphilus]
MITEEKGAKKMGQTSNGFTGIFGTAVGAVVGAFITGFFMLFGDATIESARYEVDYQIEVEKVYQQLSYANNIISDLNISENGTPFRQLIIGENKWSMGHIGLKKDETYQLYNKLLALDELRGQILSTSDKDMKAQLTSIYWNELHQIKKSKALMNVLDDLYDERNSDMRKENLSPMEKFYKDMKQILIDIQKEKGID